ncbi:MAG TPA: nitrite reductase, partial [Gammaproteobacteria bacterium]|nr:nitrite reductase [Gammaproteobacteria bacterium]
RFRRTGSPWPEQERDHVAQWPATATVCNCMGVTRGTLSNAMQAGCRTAEALSAETGASTVCGSCRPLVQELVGGAPQRQAVPRAGALVTVATLTVALIVLMSAVPISFPDSAEWSWRWDQLWRDAFYKQVSGFSLLGFMVLLGLLGL